VIDLHSHTNESDGSLSPPELVRAAQSAGLSGLAITDHDTFAGFDKATVEAHVSGLDLICGVEITATHAGHSVHLLAYFPDHEPTRDFREWLVKSEADRRERNQRLVENLRAAGVEITLEEVTAVGGAIAGRPHFAQVLERKGYASSIEDAFRKYLGETAPTFVERNGPVIEEAIARVRETGGAASLAHPVRLGLSPREEETLIARWVEAGLTAIEAYHPDHSVVDARRYLAIARKYDLAVTGGSDFHGAAKPNVRLGDVRFPPSVLRELRAKCFAMAR
jgi:3',5'-nucleoside bisphosphate phosphatase